MRDPALSPQVTSQLRNQFDAWAKAQSENSQLGAGQIHRLTLAITILAREHIPSALFAELDVAQRFLSGHASRAELGEARSNAWSFVTGLACGVGPRDGSAAQVVMACLEPDQERYTLKSLFEHTERVLALGVVPEVLWRTLAPPPAD